jgi:ubiquinone/menaquinone biosynthesis C-methylase UbiE
MKRTPEPELMLNAEHCQQYYKFPRDQILDIVMQLIKQTTDKDATFKVADLGTGPGQLPKLIHDEYPNATIDAYDGSMSMLDIAYHHVGETDRVELMHMDLRMASRKYDYVVSVFTLHQLHDPAGFWQTIERITDSDGKVIIVDLLRPESEDAVNRIFEYTKTKGITIPEYFEQDFRNSLHAAFTIDELQEQIDKIAIPLEFNVLSNPTTKDDFSLVVIKNFQV